MKTVLKLLPAACSFCFSVVAFGGEAPLVIADARTVPSLGSIVVTVNRSETRLDEMPLHTTVVSREDIEKSPAQFLDQLLRDIPGMNFSGIPAALSDPTGQQSRMRGLGNAKVLVLLDGVPLHDPFYLTTQWFKVPLSNIERVEIIRGGNSSHRVFPAGFRHFIQIL